MQSFALLRLRRGGLQARPLVLSDLAKGVTRLPLSNLGFNDVSFRGATRRGICFPCRLFTLRPLPNTPDSNRTPVEARIVTACIWG